MSVLTGRVSTLPDAPAGNVSSARGVRGGRLTRSLSVCGDDCSSWPVGGSIASWRAPQTLQKRASARSSAPHDWHSIDTLLLTRHGPHDGSGAATTRGSGDARPREAAPAHLSVAPRHSVSGGTRRGGKPHGRGLSLAT